MKHKLFPALVGFALFFVLCLLVLVTRRACPACGGPVYLFFLDFCRCR